jgi:uncharacterized protein HemX
LTAEQKSFFKLTMVLGLALVLGLGLSACGGKKSMEGAGEEEQVGTVNGDEQATHLAGEEEGVAHASFDEAEKAKRLAALPKGSTASGSGKKKTMTVKPGDTLWKIAERQDVYGSGWLYPLIYKANKDVIKDPNQLDAGLKLIIPRDVSKVEEEIAKEQAMTGQILDTSPLPGSQPKEVKVAKVAKKAKRGKAWLWVLVALVVGVGFFQWRRMKQQAAEEEAVTAPA